MATKDRTFRPPSHEAQREELTHRAVLAAASMQARQRYELLARAAAANPSDSTAMEALDRHLQAAITQGFCMSVDGVLTWKAARHVSVSRDAVAGAVDARIELAQAAAPRDPPRRGRPGEYGKVRAAAALAEREGFELGQDEGRARVGTADKGKLARRVQEALHVSPTRAADMLRQAADLAGELPEKRVGRKNPSR